MGRNTLPILLLYRRQRRLERRVTELESSYRYLSARVRSLAARCNNGRFGQDAQDEYNAQRTQLLSRLSDTNEVDVIRARFRRDQMHDDIGLCIVAVLLFLLNLWFWGAFHGLA